MLYSKLGSIPKPQTDGTEGWIEVPDAPTDIPDGHELFWDGFEWLIIPPKPVKDGYDFAYYKAHGWVEYQTPAIDAPIEIVFADSVGADSL